MTNGIDSATNRANTIAQTGQVGQVSSTGGKRAASAAQYDAADLSSLDSAISADGAMAQPGVVSPDSMIILLTAISNKMASERSKNVQGDIKARGKEKQLKHKETVDKLQKMLKAQRKSKTGALVGKIFGWVAVALMFVVAAAVAVVSGGLAAAPLFAAATITLGVMIMQETGGTEKLMDATNMSQKDRMIFSISMAVAMVVINLAAAALSFGAGSAGAVSAVTELAEAGVEVSAEAGAAAAEGAAEAGSTAATVTAETTAEVTSETTAAVTETVAETASETTSAATETTTETMAEVPEIAGETIEEGGSTAGKAASEGGKSTARAIVVAQKVKAGAAIMGGVSGIGSGSGTAVSTAANYEAGQAAADTKDLKSQMLKLDAMNEEDMAHLRKILEQIQDQVAQASLMLAGSFSTSKKIFSSSSV